jgi:hypothetical protein
VTGELRNSISGKGIVSATASTDVELDGDNLTFRFCTKCAGNLEYCQDHLYTHIHVTGDNNNQNTQKN